MPHFKLDELALLKVVADADRFVEVGLVGVHHELCLANMAPFSVLTLSHVHDDRGV